MVRAWRVPSRQYRPRLPATQREHRYSRKAKNRHAAAKREIRHGSTICHRPVSAEQQSPSDMFFQRSGQRAGTMRYVICEAAALYMKAARFEQRHRAARKACP